MAYQQNSAYAANQPTYGYPATSYYPQVVIEQAPTNYYQQPNDAAYQAQSHQFIPAGFHQQQHPQHHQPYPPPAFHDTTAVPPTPTSVIHGGQLSKAMERENVDTSKPPLDYQLLLLSLAEDYFNAAHGQGSLVALAEREMELERYYKLIATGLGCLETVLKHWRLQPRLEATVRLRYASILHEETDNDMEAETVLSTGINHCERHRLIDLKYSMQHLLVRVVYKTKPRAALKSLDGIINDVEAYQHIAWAYSFRFLRVSFSLDLSSHQETNAANHNLRTISSMASKRGDSAVVVTAAILEALTHIRSSNTAESIEHAQTALATVRSQQLDETVRQLPQLITIMHLVDVFCSLQVFNSTQAIQKMQAMHAMMDPAVNDNHWKNDGSFAVPVTQAGNFQNKLGPGGIVYKDGRGREVLAFTWMPREDIYALAYLLSGAVVSHRNSWGGQKAEKYFREGLRMTQRDPDLTKASPASVSSAVARIKWRRTLNCYLQLNLCFALCARTDWTSALTSLKSLKEAASTITVGDSELLEILIQYLTGVIHQSTGNLTDALSIFQNPSIAFQPVGNGLNRNQTRRDISILATLNSILILREPSHPQHSRVDSLLSAIESACTSHSNKNILSAYYFIKSTAHVNDPILKTKQYLQYALQAAKAAANTQLTCMTLNIMSWKFFRGVVGDQAEDSARASQNLAKRSGSNLWISVADRLLADALEVQGKHAEAEAARAEATGVAEGLPEGVRRSEDGERKDVCQ